MEYQVLEQLKTFETVTKKPKIVSKVQSAKYWPMYEDDDFQRNSG